MVLDTASASETDIDRMFPSTSPSRIQRQAYAYLRESIKALQTRGRSHSTTWLLYRSRSGAGPIQVFVWARVPDAAAETKSLQRARAKVRAELRRWLKQPGASVQVSPWGIRRVRNVVISYSPSVRSEARRIRAAAAVLASTR